MTRAAASIWGAVAESGDGLACLVEVADDLEDARVEAKVLGRPAARDDEAVVASFVDVVEGGVEREVVAALFGVGLVAFEVVDGSGDGVAFFLAGADGVDGVADDLKGLKRDHDFVVFYEVADEHEKTSLSHCFCLLDLLWR